MDSVASLLCTYMAWGAGSVLKKLEAPLSLEAEGRQGRRYSGALQPLGHRQ